MSFRYENRQAGKIALLFMIIGLAWIYGSDYLVELLARDTEKHRLIQSLKGSVFVLSASVILFFLVRGLLLQIREHHHDIVSSEKRLRKTLDSLIEGCQIVDFNWEYIYLNDVAAQHGKKKREELLGKTIMDAYPGIEKTDLFRHLKTVMHKRVSDKIINRFNFDDGSSGWFELNIEPVPEGIFILSYDITRRKEALIALEQSRERLMDAQRIAHLGDFKWSYATGKVTWSEGLYELLGYKKDEQIDFNRVNQEIHHPDDLSRVTAWLDEAVGNREQILKPLEYRVYRKDGRLIFIRTTGVVDYSEPEAPVIFATVQDITDQKLADLAIQKKNEQLESSLAEIEAINRKLLKALDQAEQSDKLKSAFLANISHEIRTPLNGIMGFSELLSSRNDLPDGTKRNYAQTIKDCSEGLLKIVNDIMDIATLESGNIKLERTTFSVDLLLAGLYEHYREKTEKSGKPCSIQLIEFKDLVYVHTDRERFQQIFMNLLDNALKFTDEGGITFGILEKKNSMVTFMVKDTGIGISEDVRELVFDRFRQGRPPEDKLYGGTGLGLSIVRELLGLMDGKIWLESAVGEGSTFYFSLPLAETPVVDGEESKHEINPAKLKKMRILIIEDEPANTRYLREITREFEAETYEAATGSEALRLVADNKFDLILLDIRLPDMNGLDVARKIRKTDPQTRIIAQTAYALRATEQQAIQAGCDAWVTKPIRKEVLMDKIRELQTTE